MQNRSSFTRSCLILLPCVIPPSCGNQHWYVLPSTSSDLHGHWWNPSVLRRVSLEVLLHPRFLHLRAMILCFQIIMEICSVQTMYRIWSIECVKVMQKTLVKIWISMPIWWESQWFLITAEIKWIHPRRNYCSDIRVKISPEGGMPAQMTRRF